MENGEILFKGGRNTGETSFSLNELLTQADKSCEGIFPLTLNVPIRRLYTGSEQGNQKAVQNTHCSRVLAFLHSFLALLLTQSSLIDTISFASSPGNPALAGESLVCNDP